jgi:predicted nuclease of restriction endonuclease-like RecB superfamily
LEYSGTPFFMSIRLEYPRMYIPQENIEVNYATIKKYVENSPFFTPNYRTW